MAKQKLDSFEYNVEIPEGVTVSLEGTLLKAKGPKGEAERDFKHPYVDLSINENSIILKSKKGTKNEKKIMGSFRAHVRNIVNGVLEGHIYKLKVCSGHFPMNVTVSKEEMVVKNFLGEKYPRKLSLIKGVDVKLDGDLITVESPDKEKAGQTAASIESLCRITNRDRRIFQDGIWLIQKGQKEI